MTRYGQERIRLLYSALGAVWVTWIVWGPTAITGHELAQRRLNEIGLAHTLGVASVIVVTACVATFFSPRAGCRWTKRTVGLVTCWWLFLTIVCFAGGLALSGGLAATGVLAGLVTYGMAPDE